MPFLETNGLFMRKRKHAVPVPHIRARAHTHAQIERELAYARRTLCLYCIDMHREFEEVRGFALRYSIVTVLSKNC